MSYYSKKITQLAQELSNVGDEALGTVNRFQYWFRLEENMYGEQQIAASPVGSGDATNSTIPYGDYRYTHGGATFRLATEMCHDIAEKLGL